MGNITYLPKRGGGWLYLATWPDRYSRKVMGWDVRESMLKDLVSEAMRRVLAVRQRCDWINRPFQPKQSVLSDQL